MVDIATTAQAVVKVGELHKPPHFHRVDISATPPEGRGRHPLEFDHGWYSPGDSLVEVSGELASPLVVSHVVPEGSITFAECISGFCVSVINQEVYPLRKGMFMAVAGPVQFYSLYGRGLQERRGFCTPTSSLAGAYQWFRDHDPDHAQPLVHVTSQALVRRAARVPDRSPLDDQELSAKCIQYYTLASAILGCPSVGFFDILHQVSSLGSSAFTEVIQTVYANPAEDWNLNRAAAMCSYSVYHFSRSFKRELGFGFPSFVDLCRAEAALRLLVNGQMPLHTVATQSGFTSAALLRQSMKTHVGLTPKEIKDFVAQSRSRKP